MLDHAETNKQYDYRPITTFSGKYLYFSLSYHLHLFCNINNEKLSGNAGESSVSSVLVYIP